MANRYGSDIRLDEFGDVVFTDEGCLEVATGGQLVAQDIRSEVLLSPGSLFWTPRFGAGLSDALKGPDTIDVEGVLRSAAFNDVRVEFDSIVTDHLADGVYRLSFHLVGAFSPLDLYFHFTVRFDDLV